MIAEEKQAKELIKKHLGRDAPSHQELTSYVNIFYGFMHYYLLHSKNQEKMTTSADYNITVTLARYDQPRDNKKTVYFTFNNFMSD